MEAVRVMSGKNWFAVALQWKIDLEFRKEQFPVSPGLHKINYVKECVGGVFGECPDCNLFINSVEAGPFY